MTPPRQLMQVADRGSASTARSGSRAHRDVARIWERARAPKVQPPGGLQRGVHPSPQALVRPCAAPPAIESLRGVPRCRHSTPIRRTSMLDLEGLTSHLSAQLPVGDRPQPEWSLSTARMPSLQQCVESTELYAVRQIGSVARASMSTPPSGALEAALVKDEMHRHPRERKGKERHRRRATGRPGRRAPSLHVDPAAPIEDGVRADRKRTRDAKPRAVRVSLSFSQPSTHSAHRAPRSSGGFTNQFITHRRRPDATTR